MILPEKFESFSRTCGSGSAKFPFTSPQARGFPVNQAHYQPFADPRPQLWQPRGGPAFALFAWRDWRAAPPPDGRGAFRRPLHSWYRRTSGRPWPSLHLSRALAKCPAKLAWALPLWQVPPAPSRLGRASAVLALSAYLSPP